MGREEVGGGIGHGAGAPEAPVALPVEGGGGDAVVVGDGCRNGPWSGGRSGRVQRFVADDRRGRHGSVVEGIGVVGGLQFVFVTVIVGIAIAVLSELAVMAQLEPVGQSVGIVVLGRRHIGRGGQARDRHGDGMDLER